jgi:hypothetical protein
MVRRAHFPPSWMLPLAGFVVLSALLVGSFFVVPYLPTNDGPQWVFATHMENHYGDPGTIYSSYYVPAPQFASRGFTLLYGPFEAWLGWQRGLQVTLGLMALLAAWGFVALVMALQPRRWALGFIGFPLSLSWGLYMGFWAYVAAGGFGLFVLAFAVRDREATVSRRAVLSALLTLQAAAHIFSAVVTGLVLLVLVVVGAPRGKRLVEVAKLVPVGLPAMAILVATSLVSDATRKLEVAQGVQFTALREMLALLPQSVAPGSLARALVVTVGIVAAAAVAGRRAWSRDADSADRALGAVAIVLLLAGAFGPITIPGWQFFSQRFLPLGAALACAVVPFEVLGAGRKLAVTCLFALSVVYVGLAYPLHRRLASTCSDAIAGLFADLHRTRIQLPVTLNPAEGRVQRRELKEVPWLDPLLHMGELYAVAEGGMTPYGFPDSAATYPFSRRAGPSATMLPPVPNPERYWAIEGRLAFRDDSPERAELEDEVTALGVFYEGVTVLGASSRDLALWHRRGYVADWERGATLLAHFEPCHIDFTVSPAAADPGPVFDLRVAGFDLVTGHRPPSRLLPDGLAHFDLQSAPCGDIELRARWDKGGRPVTCESADAGGFLKVTLTRESSRVVCIAVAVAP